MMDRYVSGTSMRIGRFVHLHVYITDHAVYIPPVLKNERGGGVVNSDQQVSPFSVFRAFFFFRVFFCVFMITS